MNAMLDTSVSVNPKLRSRKTLENPHLKRLQQLHAWTVNGLSFLGCGLALGLWALGYPPTAAELSVFVALLVLTQIGIIVGFHRHFTHRSFQAKPYVRAILAALGSAAAQGNLVFWVALHRFHHDHSDCKGDPHSPYLRGEQSLGFWQGLWHSHMGWSFDHPIPNPNHYATDMLRVPILTQVNRLYFLWIALGLAVPAGIGFWGRGNWTGALFGLLWGGLTRICITQNLVWSITSLAHIWGTHDLDSGDRSTNNLWLALLTFGESWHNNHHAFPQAAIVGWKWWQIDIAGGLIRLLEKTGLAWEVKIPTDRAIAAKEMRTEKIA